VALAAGALCAAVAAGPALAQGLPRNYDVQRIDTPHQIGSPEDAGKPNAEQAAPNFGWGVASADLTRDGDRELLVPQSQSNFDGEIFIFDGQDGRKLDTIKPPEGKGQGVELAFVYVETMPDIGSCPGGQSSQVCGASTIGAGDGIPEILAGSRALSVGGKKVGRAYVFDGATRSVLKKIDMPPADLAKQPTGGGANFGRLVMSPSGLPACAGLGSEGNDAGVARCPGLPQAVRLGDVDGGGKPDIVVTARSYQEPRTDVVARAPNSECARSTAPNCTSGRVYVYRGEEVVGSPGTPLDTPYRTIDNPAPQAASQEFGGNLFRVGDVSNDGLPEFAIAARNTDYPITAPEPERKNVGAAFLVDPSKPQGSSIVKNYTHPEEQPGAEFTLSFNSGPAPGDLGHTALPDLFLPATFQNRTKVDQGRGFVFKGDLTGSGGSEQSFHFATLDDPTPDTGGNFGGSQAGVGDLVPGPANPANELLLGGIGPFDPNTEATARIVTDVHFFNATTERVLQTITDPDRNPGSGFGLGITPMGDLNEDRFLDFGVTSYLSDAPGPPSQGRAFIFRSNNAPPPTVPPPPKPGRCANDKYGTQKADNLRGTNAGDRIFVFAGNDVVDALAGDDCIDGGTGGDRLSGGLGNDTVVAQGGHDVVFGQGGNDRLYGGDGNDGMTGGAGRDLLAGGRGADVQRGDLDDQIYGEAGEDRISAGRGRTRIDAGNDNDYVIARNGRVDTINCGRGRDTARVDRPDRTAGCERVIHG
jgi:hypothetical protein